MANVVVPGVGEGRSPEVSLGRALFSGFRLSSPFEKAIAKHAL